MMKITKEWLGTHRWFLRTSDNGVGYNGYKRKRVGAWNDAGDKWTGIATCRGCGGFFGIDELANEFGLLPRRTLELCEWRGERVVVGDKICVSSYRVVAVGADIPAEAFECCGYKYARDGEKIRSGRWIAVNVSVLQSGGGCYMYGNSTNNQSDGYCYMYGNSINHQSGGGCYMFGKSTNHQSGGYYYMYDKGCKIVEVKK